MLTAFAFFDFTLPDIVWNGKKPVNNINNTTPAAQQSLAQYAIFSVIISGGQKSHVWTCRGCGASSIAKPKSHSLTWKSCPYM